MLKNIIRICCFFLLFNCTNIKKSNNDISILDTIKKARLEVKEDTILEKNNPKFLDLSRHQIFIDTTRNSKFYKSLIKWKETELDKDLINSAIDELGKDVEYIRDSIDNFPKRFITLRKLNNKFVLYDRCDGIDPRFAIKKGLFIFYGPLESYAELITKVRLISKDKIELELKTHKNLSSDEKSIIEIEKIDNFLYIMKYKNESYNKIIYLTTTEYIEDFDLVVNHCPKMKMPAIIDKFDNFKKEDIIEVEE